MIPLLLALACGPKIDIGPSPVDEAARPVTLVTLPAEPGPNVYVQAVIRAGSALDPIGQEGIAALTARSLLEGGAGARSGREIRSALYPTGTEVDIRVDREWVSVRLRCHRDHARQCTDLLGELLTAPRFDTADVERVRDAALYQVNTGLMSNEEALGMAVFDVWTFEGQPYGHPVSGRGGVLPLLDAEAARTFHQSTYVREAITVGIAGAWTEADSEALQASLAALPAQRMPELVLPDPVTPSGRRLLAVDTDTEVTGFHFGHPLPVDRTHPDWMALHVGLTAFGQHRESHGRLFRTLRTDRGLNYGDYAYVESYAERGDDKLAEQGILRRKPSFHIWIRPTSLENGPFALKLAIDELERLVADGITEAEFEDTRRSMHLGTPLLATDPGRRLAYRLDAATTGTPELLAEGPAALDALDLAQVNAALAKHLHPDQLRIVAVSGEADALLQRLLEESPTPIVYADVTPGPEQAARDATVAAKALGLDPTQSAAVTAEGIFR